MSDTITCQSQQVTLNTNNPPVDLGVFIGKTAEAAATTTYQITQGSTFGVKLVNTLSTDPDTGYACANILPTGATNDDWSAWQGEEGNALNYADGLGTSKTQPGTYTFGVTCRNLGGGATKKANAKLKVVSSHEGEI